MADSTPPRSALHSSCDKLIRPRLTSRSGSTPSPFQAQGEISPGKNALLHCTTVGFTPPRLGHKSFAISGSLALPGNAFYPLDCSSARSFAPRFLPTFGHPHAVALHFVRCDLLTTGLTPVRVRPCWAHQKRPSLSGRPFLRLLPAIT